jgi:hypothetical protein
MKTNALVLALILAAQTAGAVNVAMTVRAGQGASFKKTDWAGPVVTAFTDLQLANGVGLGDQRAILLGLTTTLVLKNAAPGSLPAEFGRFVDKLADQETYASTWAGLKPQAKLESLQKAAAAAVASAGQEADALPSEGFEALTYFQAQGLDERVSALYADRLYLDSTRSRKIQLLYKAVQRLKAERSAQMEEWMKLTAGKMARGDFDGVSPIVRDGKDGGWAHVDASPDMPRYATFEEAVLARIAQADDMPEGPWKARMYAAVAEALDSAAAGEQGLEEERRKELLTLALEKRDAAAGAPDSIAAALASLKAYKAGAKKAPIKDAKALLEHYDGQVSSLFRQDSRKRWRLGAAIETGKYEAEGYLSRERLTGIIGTNAKAQKTWIQAGFAAAAVGALGGALALIGIPALITGFVIGAATLLAPYAYRKSLVLGGVTTFLGGLLAMLTLTQPLEALSLPFGLLIGGGLGSAVMGAAFMSFESMPHDGAAADAAREAARGLELLQEAK